MAVVIVLTTHCNACNYRPATRSN